MRYKVFTLQEAQGILSTLRPLMTALSEKKHRMVQMHEHLLTLELVDGTGPALYDTPEGKAYLAHAATLENVVVSFEADLKHITQLGCIIRDIEAGIVDFYFVHKTELVFLNWMLTDDEISFWHDIDTSYRDRLPLTQLLGK